MWLDDKLCAAPLSSEPKMILDVGCGSGAWTVDAATTYSTARVVGIDLTPPALSVQTPQNCTFLQADAELEWDFVKPGERFDFIYARMLANGMHDWPSFMARCYRYLEPGGWIEIPDIEAAGLTAKDNSRASPSPAVQWFSKFRAATVRSGIDAFANDKHTERLKESGFINIRGTPVRWLVGGASGTTEKDRLIGDILLSVVEALIRGVTESLLQYEPGIEPGAIHALASEAIEDLRSNQATRCFTMNLYEAIALAITPQT